MKQRRGAESNDGVAAGSKRNPNWIHKNKRRNQQRMGGKGGLSLQAFANAKSLPSSSLSAYNPAIIKKQREFYKNAKIVKKYRKSVTQQNQPNYHQITKASNDEDGNDTQNVSVPSHDKKKPKKNVSLQSVRAEYEKKHAEEEKARLEREAMIEARKEEKAKAETRRKVLKDNMFRRTRSGQPVMKYRIQHILEGLTDTSK